MCRTVRCKKEALKCLCFRAAMQMLSCRFTQLETFQSKTDDLIESIIVWLVTVSCSLSIWDIHAHLACSEVLSLCVAVSSEASEFSSWPRVSMWWVGTCSGFVRWRWAALWGTIYTISLLLNSYWHVNASFISLQCVWVDVSPSVRLYICWVWTAGRERTCVLFCVWLTGYLLFAWKQIKRLHVNETKTTVTHRSTKIVKSAAQSGNVSNPLECLEALCRSHGDANMAFIEQYTGPAALSVWSVCG